MDFHYILKILGIGLLILGGFSGVVLFLRAASGKVVSEDSSANTLWGLFLLCLISGLVILMLVFFNLI